MRAGEVLWFRIRPRGQRPIRVVFGTPATSPELRPRGNMTHLHGFFLYGPRMVLINALDPPAEQVATLGHELLHAAAEGCGVRAATEERVVGATDHRLWPLFAALGARPPKRPPGYRRLRASGKRAAARASRPRR